VINDPVQKSLGQYPLRIVNIEKNFGQVFDTLEKTLGRGNAEKLEVTQAVDTDPTKGIPIMTAYLAAHPDLKAIGT
jgi:ABC-type sugar transport system substrate-binding protein